ncbi:MAG TPA: fluoride efflux transporter CrcB [Pseudogracilibacillus sp.]|nr:fluoride efflux transporter CrcB [Pseudogracilibacillus sp.]
MNIVAIGAVIIGGSIGAILRYGAQQFFSRIFQTTLPLATLIVNIVGSFLLGLFVALQIDELLILFFGIGILGAFTTFSTVMVETIQLYVQKKYRIAFLYQFLSYGGGILLAFCGFLLGTLL